MSGGLMQIVAQGAQDKYLTVDPQITYFKVQHKRHTNFALESIEQTFNGSVGGGRVSATISRNGDLIHTMWLEFDVDVLTGKELSVYDLIEKVTIEIGGTQVDRHTGDWLKIWQDLSTPAGKHAAIDRMTTCGEGKQKLRVPLSFWFCRDAGQALPLIALQYHEVKLSVNFTEKAKTGAVLKASPSCKLWVDYVYLDTDERQRFARSAHEYLIEQVQHSGADKIESKEMKKVRLNFNHPVKELVWVTRDVNDNRVDAVKSAKLQLNGHDRFSERDGDYFSLVQRHQYHTNGVPKTESGGLYVYSFALKPEELQPSGSCNMSRIDHATLQMEIKDSTLATKADVYAVNYNVLRIKNGMGGLAYSN